jgi:hypothetical protein
VHEHEGSIVPMQGFAPTIAQVQNLVFMLIVALGEKDLFSTTHGTFFLDDGEDHFNEIARWEVHTSDILLKEKLAWGLVVI